MRKDYRLTVEWRPISQVVPYQRNAKKHPPSQIIALAHQISQHGFDQPIVVDAAGVIIKGHGRREAALQAGMTEVPVIVRTDLTENEAKAIRLADNVLPTYGEVDNDILRFEFGSLQSADFDLKLTGYEFHDIEKIMLDDGEVEEEKKETSAAAAATQFILAVECLNEPQMQELHSELTRRGLAVKMVL